MNSLSLVISLELKIDKFNLEPTRWFQQSKENKTSNLEEKLVAYQDSLCK